MGPSGRDDHTQLHEAAKADNVEGVQRALATTDVNTRGFARNTALHEAVFRNAIDATEALLRAKINVNAKQREGITALMFAAEKGNADIVDMLIAADADLSIVANNGKCAVDFAREHGAQHLIGCLSQRQVQDVWVTHQGTPTQPYQPEDVIKFGQATETVASISGGHDFFFVLASKLKSSSGPLPRFQDLQGTGWLVTSRVSIHNVVDGSMRSAAAVSHVWLTTEHPDPEGEQADVIREFLHKRPEIEVIWVDWCCLPQGKEKTVVEQDFFSQSLKAVNLVYLALNVIIVLDSTYLARFWPQFEAFLSFQQVDSSGLKPLPANLSRNAILCTGLAAQSTESVKRLSEELESRWRQVSVTRAIDNLSKGDVLVTNRRDKDIQLQKLKELQDHLVQSVKQL